MYQLLKKGVSTILNKKRLFQIEPFLRFAYAIFYTGNKYQCTVCKKKLSKWVIQPNADQLCPQCGSLKRGRRLYSLLTTTYLKPHMHILHFSPSRALYRALKAKPNITYITTDLSGDFLSDQQWDITQMNAPSNSFDLIICYHILEHITSDSQAMAELYRVLKPSGRCLIQTPFKEGQIYEDWNITTPQERLLHFHQEDHVRIYSVNGLKHRLEAQKFKVKTLQFTETESNYFGFKTTETILECTK